MGPDEREIREVHSTWIDVVNAGNLVRLLTLMAGEEPSMAALVLVAEYDVRQHCDLTNGTTVASS